MRLIRFQKLACDARIFVADNFVSPAEIDQILALTADPSAWGPRRDETGLHFELPADASPCVSAIGARLRAALGFRGPGPQTLRYRRYHPSEYHPPHTDSYEIGGERLTATAMLWLTACEAGGETRFLNTRPAPMLLAPRAGRMAVWLNYGADGAPDPASMHEGAAVVRGVKTTLTCFVYGPVDAQPAFAKGLEPCADIDGVRFERAKSAAGAAP
jgi:hypothetical protein